MGTHNRDRKYFHNIMQVNNEKNAKTYDRKSHTYKSM